MLKGVMLNKDVTHPRMRRMIKDPRIVLLDCSLEYKKGESQVTEGGDTEGGQREGRDTQGGGGTRGGAVGSDLCWRAAVNLPGMFPFVQTDIEISKEEDFARILQMEEEYIQQICEDIIRLKPDLIFTEKGISGEYSAHTPVLVS